MEKPTLLFVEENENTLSYNLANRRDLQLVLLRFMQNMHFTSEHLTTTASFPTFGLDKGNDIDTESERFRIFCRDNNISIDHFFNDSEFNQELVQGFARTLGLNGALTYEQARIVRDKFVMKEMLNDLGYRTMNYSTLKSEEDVVSFAEQNDGFPIIVKWRRGLSSKEVYKVNSLDELKALGLDYSTERYIAETYCPDLIWCLDSLVQNGNVMGNFITWLPYTNLSFAVRKEKFAQITVDKKPDKLKFDDRKLTQDIITGVGLKNGYLHLEAFIQPNGSPIICEFAWRTAGDHMLSNHSKAFGIDVYGSLIDIMIGKRVAPVPQEGKTCVGDMFLPLSDGQIKSISSFEELKELEGVVGGKVKYKRGDKVTSRRQYTDSSGWVQVSGRTEEEVLSRMLKIYERFELVME